MEQEKILTGYNHAVMTRLLKYAGRHRGVLSAALVSLLVASVGQLSLPILIQRGVDESMVHTHVELLSESALQEHSSSASALLKNAQEVGSITFIPRESMQNIAGAERERLYRDQAVGRTEYQLVPANTAIEALPADSLPYIHDGNTMAFTPERFSQLPREITRELRSEDIQHLQNLSLVFLTVLGAVLLTTFAQVYLMTYAGQSIMRRLRLELFSHTIRQNMAFLNLQPVGRLVNRLTNDVETINQMFTSVLITIIRDVIMMAGAITALLVLHVPLGLITIASLIPVFLITSVFRRLSRGAFRKVRLQVSMVNTFLSEHFSGMSIVQLFARETRTKHEFRRENDSLVDASLHEMRIFAVFRPIIDLLSSTTTAIMIWFGAGLFLQNLVSLGILIAFINLIREFYRPVMELSEQFTILQSALAGGERVFEALDSDQRIADTGTEIPEHPQGELRFSNVQFSYKPGIPVIRNLTLEIPSGSTIAVVGYTGAGKTTITKLLTRLYDIDAGSIQLDGRDIRSLPLKTLRGLIQPIQQDVFLFRGTIAENISLGRQAGAFSIEQSAQLAQANHFIESLPHGYQTELQENGANISTGQRQLLAFARTLFHNPRVIILDEATANIDTETEKVIQQAMQSVLQGRTSLVIAHRLSTIQQADQIIVLSHGEIAENGTHDELISMRGIYYSLYRLQYQDSLPAGWIKPTTAR